MSDMTKGYGEIPCRKPLNRFRVIRSYSNRDRLLLTLWQVYTDKQKRIQQVKRILDI